MKNDAFAAFTVVNSGFRALSVLTAAATVSLPALLTANFLESAMPSSDHAGELLEIECYLELLLDRMDTEQQVPAKSAGAAAGNAFMSDPCAQSTRDATK